MDPALVPVLAWTPDDLKEFTDDIPPALEQWLVQRLTSRAVKGKLHPGLLKDIENDSRWDAATKKSLCIILPRLIAKYLNLAGVSAQWKDETILGILCIRVWSKQSKLEAKLDQIIAQNNREQNPAPKTEEKKTK